MDDYIKLFMIFILIIASIILVIRNNTIPYLVSAFVLLAISNFLVLYSV